jgi:hypothetical protein
MSMLCIATVALMALGGLVVWTLTHDQQCGVTEYSRQHCGGTPGRTCEAVGVGWIGCEFRRHANAGAQTSSHPPALWRAAERRSPATPHAARGWAAHPAEPILAWNRGQRRSTLYTTNTLTGVRQKGHTTLLAVFSLSAHAPHTP